eukprot:scaffold420_cov404-Prasinococcus_capsulatus_cf.AAC.6
MLWPARARPKVAAAGGGARDGEQALLGAVSGSGGGAAGTSTDICRGASLLHRGKETPRRSRDAAADAAPLQLGGRRGQDWCGMNNSQAAALCGAARTPSSC